ncbi:PREDICTED: putative gustatory receptor 28b, partial [Wasmannia auropunctata]|uniref:putative gustatory receptor 28b n=1 Tax=Wasmannia auropunctata TaxID=64793 RepID=UPI0005EDE187
MKLKALKKQHMAISNTVQKLNMTFSVQLLATITIIFCHMNIELYSSLLHWHDGLVIKLDKQIGKMILNSMTYYIIKITFIMWVCETGKNQAQEIRTTIHDVLNSTRDEQIKHELQLFSLQTMHCKNTFSAKGFNMDATFLTTVSNRAFAFINKMFLFIFFIFVLDDG